MSARYDHAAQPVSFVPRPGLPLLTYACGCSYPDGTITRDEYTDQTCPACARDNWERAREFGWMEGAR